MCVSLLSHSQVDYKIKGSALFIILFGVIQTAKKSKIIKLYQSRISAHTCFWGICTCIVNQCQSVCAYCLIVIIYVSCLLQSQQPLEDLDAQLRRALSPETVPVSTHTQVNTCVQILFYSLTRCALIHWPSSTLTHFLLHANHRPLTVAHLQWNKVCIGC